MGESVSEKVTTTRARGKNKPSIVYSDKLLAVILDRVASGESLCTICDADDMPSRKSFFQWVKDNPEIQAQYEFAIQMRADKFAEDIIQISDDGTRDTYTDENGNERTNQDVIARSRLRVDARKWLASKMAPKKYGDRVEADVKHSGAVEIKNITRTIIDHADDTDA